MPSVLGLLEARETKVREEVARLREEAERVEAALGEAERALQRLADARVTVAEVLAEPPVAVAEPVDPRNATGRRRGRSAGDGDRYAAVPARVHPGLQAVPAKVEGLRSKARRLVERGWVLQVQPGVFTPLGASGG
ncbi:hypothetical protein [Streptomyces sp. NPDC004658]|uniref:hypothetical protein n=1 Tax=Streptomyces sp. NPDC004658 TaxID=3154672 RepID=UPI0033B54F35